MKKHFFLIALICSIFVACGPKPELPTVSTVLVDYVTENSATCAGEIINDGYAEIMSQGFCWSTEQNPTLDDNVVEGGYTVLLQKEDAAPVYFEAELSGLLPSTEYYVRAYATNSEGTAYGDNVSFTTLEENNDDDNGGDDNGGDDNGGNDDEIVVEMPTVATSVVTEITQTSAKVAGNVTADGGAEVIARGICWSKNQNPTIEASFTTEGNGIGEFTSTIEELTANTTYYARAYATNSKGTSYGEEVNFTTLEEESVVELPTITTVTVSEITIHSAMVSAEVLADGGADVIEYGFYWNKANAGNDEPTEPTEPTRVKVGEGLGVFTHTLSGLLEETKYYVCAYAINSAGEIVSDGIYFTTLKDNNGGDDNTEYAYVDLGLPSGTLWAEHNVGALFPEGYGDHFAYGEIEPKANYTSDNCSSYQQDLGEISGNPMFDAATANWGDDWRMPTLEEMFELTQECTWTWTEVNGVSGFKVASKTNGNSIFLPASGFRAYGELIDQNVYGYYWTSTPYEEEGATPTFTKACFLDMCSYQVYCNWSLRRNGMTIRPVRN